MLKNVGLGIRAAVTIKYHLNQKVSFFSKSFLDTQIVRQCLDRNAFALST